jgi:5-methylthioadenosine/S-adenosylhomocysteine deaminase
MCPVLLSNAKLLYDPYSLRTYADKSIYLEDGIIEAVSESSTGYKTDLVIDCKRKLVLPGLANTHTHLAMTLLRGAADDLSLRDWLSKTVWPSERRMGRDHVRAGTALGLVELIKSGVTAFADMYFFEDAVEEETVKAGLRAHLAPAVSDGGVPASDVTDVLAMVKSKRNSNLIRWALGPHSLYSCSKETLLTVAQAKHDLNLPVHMHLAETRWSEHRSMEIYGLREVDALERLGLLGEDFLGAHGVWLTKQEVNKLGNYRGAVSYCPVSNMKLAEGGHPPIPEMINSGVRVSFGTDGAASNNSLNIFETIKVGALLLRHMRWDPAVLSPAVALRMATETGYAVLGFPRHPLAPGGIGDLITISLDTPSLQGHPAMSVASSLVYSPPLNVEDMIVDGRPVMVERNILHLKEEKVIEDFRKASLSLEAAS